MQSLHIQPVLWRRRLPLLPLPLLFSCCLAVLSFTPSVVRGSVDDRAKFDPCTVAIVEAGVGPERFLDPSVKYTARFRNSVLDFLTSQGAIDDNFPLESISRTTTAQPNQTVWQFTIVYQSRAQSAYTVDTLYTALAVQCVRDPNDQRKCTVADYGTDGNPTREWLSHVSQVNLVCCDGSWQPLLSDCPVCEAKSYLALILGLSIAFIGTMLLVVALTIWWKKRNARRKTRTAVSDAGHRPPPANLGPAFDVHKHSNGHSGHANANGHANGASTTAHTTIHVAQRPDHVAHMNASHAATKGEKHRSKK